MDSSDDSKGFLKHVFNFDDDSKYDILNIIQYAMIALIPVIILIFLPFFTGIVFYNEPYGYLACATCSQTRKLS